ncbi:unnamed protein product [Schistosoma mattheei]|uniref:Uncharacterized protein n=1 Tax=Schistosoma mattheei TaxID=31246 RepID=A0A183Q6U7_9TREM|nr:unnamed protein product [Schistosoma mattheei]
MNIVQCYAPTNDSNDDIKDQFYERMQLIIEKCPRKDLTILMGYLNTKVGIDNTGYEDMRRHGLTGRKKRKWRRICKSVCIQQIGHRRHNISTQTYTQGYIDLNGHTTENQIDHISINKKSEGQWKMFQALQDLLKEEETTMENNWKGIKEALTSTCQEVLGLKKHHHKEWISTETLDKIKEKKTAINKSRTRAEKVQAQAEYIEANKQVKKSIKADKYKYVEELATTW